MWKPKLSSPCEQQGMSYQVVFTTILETYIAWILLVFMSNLSWLGLANKDLWRIWSIISAGTLMADQPYLWQAGFATVAGGEGLVVVSLFRYSDIGGVKQKYAQSVTMDWQFPHLFFPLSLFTLRASFHIAPPLSEHLEQARLLAGSYRGTFGWHTCMAFVMDQVKITTLTQPMWLHLRLFQLLYRQWLYN